MKVHVYAWVGQPLPDGMRLGDEEITPERLFELFNAGFDVALMHTRREVKPGEPDGTPLLALDERGKQFRQR